MTTPDELREAVRAQLDELRRRVAVGHDLTMGPKTERLLAYVETEPEWGPTWREAIEGRAAELAAADGGSKLFTYHVIQALVELFNEDPAFRRTMHAQVDTIRPREGLQG